MRRRAFTVSGALALIGCAGETWRGRSPEPPTRFEVALPPLSFERLPSGLTVAWLRSSRAGLVSLTLVSRMGYDRDPSGREGLAEVCRRILVRRAGGPHLDLQFGALGTRPSIALDRDRSTIAIDVLPWEAEVAAELLAAMVPSEPPELDELEAARADVLAALDRARGSPDVLAGMALARIFAPWGGRPNTLGSGDAASLAAITAGDVAEYFARLRNVQDAAFVAAGPLAQGEAASWAASAFQAWSSVAPSIGSGAAKIDPVAAPVVFVPFRGLEQSLVAIGGLAPSASDPAFDAFEIALDVFRGRLAWVLRERRRITYGPASSVPHEPDAFAIALRVRADATRLALDDIEMARDASLDDISDGGFERIRLSRATSVMRLAQDPQVAASLAVHAFVDGSGGDALRRRLAGMRGLDPRRISDAASEYLARKRLRVVVVGDPARIGRQLGRVETWQPAELFSPRPRVARAR